MFVIGGTVYLVALLVIHLLVPRLEPARTAGVRMIVKDAVVIGRGGAGADLSADDMRQIVARRAARPFVPASRVLAVIPDRTRDDNTDLLFPMVSQALAARGAVQLDALVAQGTHPPMTDGEKRAKIGAGPVADMPLLGTVFDHHWDRPSELTTLGTISADDVSALTGGLMRAGRADAASTRGSPPGSTICVLVVGATVPARGRRVCRRREVFLPRRRGPGAHAPDALARRARDHRARHRPRRDADAARDREGRRRSCTTPVIAFTSVSTRGDDGLQTHALFTGDLRETVRQAAAVSAQVHVRYTGRRYRRVVALLDEHYDELWVGGKASYKLGGIIERRRRAGHLRAAPDRRFRRRTAR